jgi:hypothetical protein
MINLTKNDPSGSIFSKATHSGDCVYLLLFAFPLCNLQFAPWALEQYRLAPFVNAKV